MSHCFAVNLNNGAPEVEGIQGILDAYGMCIRTVQLAGPTVFSPVRRDLVRVRVRGGGGREALEG